MKKNKRMTSLWVELISNILLVIVTVIVIVISVMYMKRMEEYEKVYWSTEYEACITEKN